MAKNKGGKVEIPSVEDPNKQPPKNKTTCPITREQFRKDAKSIEVNINGQGFRVPTKEFSTGSLGWYLNGKTTVNIDGKDIAVQVGLNVTIIGSKELPK